MVNCTVTAMDAVPMTSMLSGPKASSANPSNWATRACPDTIALFDVDGTLTPSRKQASEQMLKLLEKLKEKVVIAYVGGSDLAKQEEQLGKEAPKALFDFGFSENGATAYRLGQLICHESFVGYLGEEKYKKLVNFTLRYIADLDIPIKRGTFIEFRNGMVNVSPIGRNCSYEERLAFEALDKKTNIRRDMVKAYEREFVDYKLKFSIGGQISIDIFPQGWDKTYCLRHLQGEGFQKIHFFGDMTHEGGNDFELFAHPAIIGHAVKNPEDTMAKVRALFNI